MKKYTHVRFILMFLMLFAGAMQSAFSISSQWSVLNSGTTEKLRDVNFLNRDYGVVVGNNATVLLTDDGGQTWTSINSHSFSGNVYSALILQHDTIVVSTFDQSLFTGETYITFDGGTNRSQIGSEPGSAHSTQLSTHDQSSIYSVGSSLDRSLNFGNSWDTLLAYTGGTNSLTQVHFKSGQIGVAGGLISGFTTYSANFARTEDGFNWYIGDVFSFPNADAYTTLSFPHEDTVFMFVNHYNGFMPSNQNYLWKMYDFLTVVNFPGDTSVHFTSQIINSSMPGYAFAADFTNTLDGFAVFTGGTIYKTTDGGVSWTSDYASTSDTLSDIEMIDENIGYAVGDDGTILKYSPTTSIPLVFNSNIHLYPNPSSGEISLDLNVNNKPLSFQIHSMEGKQCMSGNLSGVNPHLNVSELETGIYILQIRNQNKILISQSKLIKL